MLLTNYIWDLLMSYEIKKVLTMNINYRVQEKSFWKTKIRKEGRQYKNSASYQHLLYFCILSSFLQKNSGRRMLTYYHVKDEKPRSSLMLYTFMLSTIEQKRIIHSTYTVILIVCMHIRVFICVLPKKIKQEQKIIISF